MNSLFFSFGFAGVRTATHPNAGRVQAVRGHFSVFPASVTRGYALRAKVQKRAKLFYIIEKSGARHGARRLWLIAIKAVKARWQHQSIARLYSITMYSAFRFFTLEQITSRLNSALDRAA